MNDVIKKEYFHRIMIINIVSYLICVNLALVAYNSNIFLFLFSLALIYFTLLLAVRMKYRTDKKYKNIEGGIKEYLKGEIPSYVFFTVFSLVIFMFVKVEEVQIFLILNFLIFVVILISYLNPMAKILKRKSKKIEDFELENNIRDLANAMGIGEVEMGILPWKNLKIANALQMGTKKVYVFISDYLFENLTPQENLAVVAHEFAHVKLRHVFKIQILMFSDFLGIAYFYFLPSIFLGNNSTTLLLKVIGIWSLIIFLSLILTVIRRKFETQADLLAAKYIPPEYLISALNKLSDLNFIPKEISKAWGLDHPSIYKRIKDIRESIK